MKKDRFTFEAERNTNNAPFFVMYRNINFENKTRREKIIDFAYWYLCKSKE
jgi:hypothetical protein